MVSKSLGDLVPSSEWQMGRNGVRRVGVARQVVVRWLDGWSISWGETGRLVEGRVGSMYVG